MLDLGTIGYKVEIDDQKYEEMLRRMDRAAGKHAGKIGGSFKKALAFLNGMSPFGGGLREAQMFSNEMANIKAIAGELNMNKLRSEIILLSGSLGTSAELANALFFACASGARGTEKELAQFTAKIAALAKTVGAGTTPVMNAATGVMNAYGLSVKDAGTFSDWFFQVVKSGRMTGAELARSIGQIATTASGSGVSLNELGATLAALTNVMPLGSAMTFLNSAIQGIVNPSASAGTAAAGLGIKLSASALKAKGFVEVLNEIDQQTQGNGDLIATLFPEESIRRLTELAGPLLGSLKQGVVEFSHQEGGASKAFEGHMRSQGEQIEALRNSGKKVLSVIVDAVNTTKALGGSPNPQPKTSLPTVPTSTGSGYTVTPGRTAGDISVGPGPSKYSFASETPVVPQAPAATSGLTSALSTLGSGAKTAGANVLTLGGRLSGFYAKIGSGLSPVLNSVGTGMKGFFSVLSGGVKGMAGAASAASGALATVGVAVAGWELGKWLAGATGFKSWLTNMFAGQDVDEWDRKNQEQIEARRKRLEKQQKDLEAKQKKEADGKVIAEENRQSALADAKSDALADGEISREEELKLQELQAAQQRQRAEAADKELAKKEKGTPEYAKADTASAEAWLKYNEMSARLQKAGKEADNQRFDHERQFKIQKRKNELSADGDYSKADQAKVMETDISFQVQEIERLKKAAKLAGAKNGQNSPEYLNALNEQELAQAKLYEMKNQRRNLLNENDDDSRSRSRQMNRNNLMLKLRADGNYSKSDQLQVQRQKIADIDADLAAARAQSANMTGDAKANMDLKISEMQMQKQQEQLNLQQIEQSGRKTTGSFSSELLGMMTGAQGPAQQTAENTRKSTRYLQEMKEKNFVYGGGN